jgi:hypothetical protein
MNSSMIQPLPLGESLNDCLLKEPSALTDLYTVTLGMRELKVAFTKDISKLYQCMEADETVQHVRRILYCRGLVIQKWILTYLSPPESTTGTDPLDAWQ